MINTNLPIVAVSAKMAVKQPFANFGQNNFEANISSFVV